MSKTKHNGKRPPVLVILVMLVTITAVTEAQSVRRECLASMCTYGTASGIELRYTIGQAYSTLVSVDKNGGLLPGFQQPAVIRTIPVFPENFQSLFVEVYPNPASGFMTFRCQETIENVSVRVIDSMGRIVFDKKPGQLNDYRINCSEWAEGIYFINLIQSDIRRSVIKLIINK